MKYSRQRESILNSLNEKLNHPTAEMVYNCVKKEQPNISLGTVYRNLNLLTDIGEVIKIPTPDGGDRFDGNVMPHRSAETGSISVLIPMPICSVPGAARFWIWRTT